ncbi:MAG: catalase family protein [Hyphomicrobiaceae bacterium]|nr:catalase family protein [Hyphomicrobiaceae bacterium]
MSPVPYSPDLEKREPDEGETGQKLNETLLSISETTAKDCGHGLRGVHAKSHAILEGTFKVHDGLTPELAQGLFAQPNNYAAVLRVSTIPGDILDDHVSVPRGVALKITGVVGDRLPGSEGDSTQDFVLVDGPAFAAPTASKFLGNLKLLARTTDRAEWAKIALSKVLRGVEKGIEAVGGKSPLITTLGGHPLTNPAGDIFYSQTPFRYGNYIAKFSLAPISPNLTALTGVEIDLSGRRDGLRDELGRVFTSDGGSWEFRVQLLTDLQDMPIEDASVVWPEDKSPYVAVATFTVGPQTAWSAGRARIGDDQLAFSVWHGLQAHQPLGSVNRVRKDAYAASAAFRGRVNKCPMSEPREPVHFAD